MSEQKKEQNKVVIVQGNLSKIIHEEGTGDIPKKGQEIHALYRGTLTTGEQFDSNQDRDNPFKFTLGQGQVIKGWDEGFASMKKGEKATLICSPDYAYGKRGSPPKIPPNSTLHFEVELLDFQDKKKQKWDLSIEEKVEEATKLKNQGNELLKTNELAKAITKYNDGIEFVDFEQDEKAKAILKILRMNASQAHLKAKQYSKAIELCTKVLKDDQNNTKTLYRRGAAYLGNKDFDLAKTDLEALLKIDPTNTDAQQELARVIQQKRQTIEKQKNFLKGMFSKGGLYDDKKPEEKKKKAEKSKQQTDSQNEQMPDLQKDDEDQGKKTETTTEKSEKEGEHKHEHSHHGGNCC